MPVAASQVISFSSALKAPLWFLLSVYLAASFEYKTNLWRNESKLGRGEEINQVFYTKPHYYLLASANFLGPMQREIFYSKGEENSISHCRRTSASFGYKMGNKNLKIPWARGLLEASKCLYVHAHASPSQREPSQMLSMLPSPFCITKNRDNAQGDFGCALTLPQTNFFETGKDFFLYWHQLLGFFTMPSSCSGIQVGIKVQAAASSQMSQGPIHPVFTSTERRHTLAPGPSASCEAEGRKIPHSISYCLIISSSA